MSGHTTPFIPPFGTPQASPDAGVYPGVVPLSSTPSNRSSRSGEHSRSGSGVNTPANMYPTPPTGWGGPGAGGGGNIPPQYPYFGTGGGTPYQPYIPQLSPYGGSQLPPGSVGPGAYTPLPPQGPGGVSLDYRGYHDYGVNSPGMGVPPPLVPPGSMGPPPPLTIPPGTPWHNGGGAMPPHHGLGAPGPPHGTPWQGPPMGGRGGPPPGGPGGGGGGGGWGFGGGAPFSAGGYASSGWGAGGFTPDPAAAAWGAFPGGGGDWGMGMGMGGGPGGPPGAWPGMGVRPGVQPELPRRRTERETVDRMQKWTAGPHYGPVLTPFQLKVVKAQLELNPLLTPVPDDGTDKVHLRWNMLMESSLVHRSCDPLQVSWSVGRNEPATFPRLSEIQIVSEHFPWTIDVKARDPDIGVTCGEAIEAIASCVDRLTSKSDFDALSSNLKKTVSDAYRFNRSRNPNVPGGKMGEGLKRADFLGDMTTFGGLEIDDKAVERVCKVVMPGYIVLRCNRREIMTREEARAQEARAKAASQVPEGRASSSRSGRSGKPPGSTRGPGSVAGSSEIGIDCEEPSDSEDYSSSDGTR